MSSPILTASGQPIYARTPRGLLRDASISRDARLLWAIIEDHTSKDNDVPWPSQETLAELMGCTDRAVRNWLNELARSGWIQVENRPGKSNRHHLVWQSPRNHGSALPRNHGSGHPGTTVPTKKNQEEEPVEETIPTLPEEGDQEPTALFNDPPATRATKARAKRKPLDPVNAASFDQWWDRYPRKGRGGAGTKPRAESAWRKQVGAGASVAELDRQLSNYRSARHRFEAMTGEAAWLLAAPKFLKERRTEFDQELTDDEVRDKWNIRAKQSDRAPAAVIADRALYLQWKTADAAGRHAIELQVQEVA